MRFYGGIQHMFWVVIALDFDAELAKFLDQPEMKKALRSFYAQQAKAGGGGTGGIAAMKEDAKKFAIEARRVIIASLPPSLRHRRQGLFSVGSERPITENDLILSPVEVTDSGDFRVYLSWDPAAVHRDSLYEEGYPDGVDDIVAVFTKSKERRKYVRGVWHDRNVRSRKAAQNDPFIRNAIDKFNAAHKDRAVTISLEDPKKYSV